MFGCIKRMRILFQNTDFHQYDIEDDVNMLNYIFIEC